MLISQGTSRYVYDRNGKWVIQRKRNPLSEKYHTCFQTTH